MLNSCAYHKNSNTFSKIGGKTLVLSAFLALVLFGGNCANAQGVNKNLSLRGVDKVNDVVISNVSNRTIATPVARNDKGVITGGAAEIDPNNIGDTLTGTNHVTYSSSDPGDATGHVDVTNPDSSTQTIYYTYTMPSDYEIKDQPSDRIDNTLNSENANKKLFQGISSNANGGVINNKQNLPDVNIISDMIGNSDHVTWGFGGVIKNSGGALNSVNSIIGDFIANTFSGSGPYGAVIYNGDNSVINRISGDFINNGMNTIWGYGGAIAALYSNSNDTNITDINGNFIGNYLMLSSYGIGGAIYVDHLDIIKNISGVFVDNNISGQSGYGGAIANQGVSSNIENITGYFVNNYVTGTSTLSGGAIYNRGIIGTTDNNDNLIGGIVNSNFYGNYAKSETGAAQGGAIYNSGTIGEINANFENNYTRSESGVSQGGAIYNTGTIDKINATFTNNNALSETGTAQGGAIWTNKDLNIIADNGTSTFKDNYVQVGDGEKDYQAIWVDGADKKLNLQQINGGKMYMYDNINGSDGYTVNIQGDGTGTYYMYNDIKNANVSFDNTTINTVNNDIHTYEFNSLALNSNTNFVADVDLVNEQMDHIETGNNYTIADGAKLTVSGMNLLNDAKKDSTKIFFAEEGLAQNVDTTVTQVAYSPIYKYDVDYVIDENDNQGYFTFARHATPKPGPTPGPSPDDFNPAVLTTPAMAQAGMMASMNATMSYAFQHSDSFTKLGAMDRFAAINANKYALAETGSGTSTDFNQNMANLAQSYENKGAWVRPYASFENIGLKNGPRVDAISYGTLVGFDTNFKELRNGWDTVFTGYVGYNGARLNYTGVTTTMNGGMLGGTQTWYKGNFWTALTATTGASVAENDTMYGHDSNVSLMAGIGSKTGYNFEFADGKFIVQPIWFMNYSMIKTFDYTNAAGVRIDSDPLHTIQLNPSVRFIGNLKHGWQPYASVGMVWNLMNQTKAHANGVKLPEMSVKPYVEYGVGVQKQVGDRFTGFFQAMMRNGGRNGIALTGGFRWALGRDSKPVQKVQGVNIKQAKAITSTSQTDKKVLKQNKNIKTKQTDKLTLRAKINNFFTNMNGVNI